MAGNPEVPIEVKDKANGQDDRQPYIVFENVCKSFGDVHVLKDINFHVMPGETLCILGRSGVGKSVSLQMIMGFLRPDSGRIFVEGSADEILQHPDVRSVYLDRRSISQP